MELSNDDIREFRDLKRWYHQNRDTATLGRDTHRPTPRQMPSPSWVTIKVKNNTSVLMRAWSPVQVDGLVDGADPSSSDTHNYPPGMLHPDRTFNATWGYQESGSTTWLADNFWHAVIIQDLPPDAVGTAVIKGTVPGFLYMNTTYAIPRQPGYMRVFPERPTSATDGFPEARTWPRGWTTDFDPLWGQSPFGTGGNYSIVRHLWKRPNNDWWGMIDLNHQSTPRACGSATSSTVPFTVAILPTGGANPTGHSAGSYQAYINYWQGFGNVGEAYPATSLVVPSQFGMIIKRPAQVWFRAGFSWTPGVLSGVMIPSVSGLYRCKGQKIEVYLDQWDAVSTSLISSKLLGTWSQGAFLIDASSGYSPGGTVTVNVNHLVNPFLGTNYDRPCQLRLRVKWSTDDGATSGLLGNVNFTNAWCDVSFLNIGAYSLSYNGSTYHPPSLAGGGGGLPEA